MWSGEVQADDGADGRQSSSGGGTAQVPDKDAVGADERDKVR